MQGRFNWLKIPTYYYDFKEMQLPLDPEECSSFFDETISIFGFDPPRKTTNAATGLRINEAFLALGVGIIASGESESFTLGGVSIDPPAAGTATTGMQASAAGLTDPWLGGVNPAGDFVQPAGFQQATMWWGGPTWKIIEQFIQNYRLRLLLNSRFEVVNESLFDLGIVWTFSNTTGASNSRIATKPYIRAMNEVMDEKGINNLFLPASFTVEDNTKVCLPAPNAPVTYGHPNVLGLANRLYSFAQPILFVPGLRFQMDFVQASPQPLPQICDLATVNAGSYAPSLSTEITGDALASCSTGVMIPGGTVRLGLVLKGFALQPSAALHYLNAYMWRGSVMAEAIAQGDHSPWLGALFNRYRDHDLRKSALGSKPEEPIPWK